MNKVHYIFFGETMLDTFGLTRQSYIAKEKEPENNLGDHGVRKYDYETGRFNSIDPLFEKYYGWSPYQYSMNNPIWAKDWNGQEPISAVAGAGAGLYIGGAVAIGVAGWAYTEATNPGTTQGLLNAVNISFSNALYDINSLLESGSVTQSRSEGNSFVSDATSVNVLLSNADQKLEQQMAKQDRKSPESQGKKPDGGNPEIYEALKRSLAGTYGAREAARILQDKSIRKLLHDFQQPFKDGQNVVKEKIPQLVEEFRDLIGK